MTGREPSPRNHAVLGVLEYDARAWRAAPSGVSVPVYLTAGREGPDAGLIDAAVDAVQQLDTLNGRAREPHLTLIAIEVGRPDAEWVRNAVAPHPRRAGR